MGDESTRRPSQRGSSDVGEDAAESGRVGEGVWGKGGDVGAGEEGYLEAVADGVGRNPLCVIGSAKGVLVEELLVCWDAEAVEVGGATSAALGGESGGEFVGGECAYLSDPEGDEVDPELLAGEGDVSGDGLGRGTRCTPIA